MIEISTSEFGKLQSGEPVLLFKIVDGDYSVAITNYGATVVEVNTPNQVSEIANINLGYQSLSDYLADSHYFGCTVGRYANRIADGQFVIDEKTYQIPTNNFPNDHACALHGGTQGFNKALWQGKLTIENDLGVLILTHKSHSGDQGFPGNLSCQITFRFNQRLGLSIEYRATTDQPTVINLTNHCYFNLSGEGQRDIYDHEVQILADEYLPVDQRMIPTGEFQSVKSPAHSAFDFTAKRHLDEQLRIDHPQMNLVGGFDHTWVVRRVGPAPHVEPVAIVTDQTSGRGLEVLSTEPGVQFYTGNFIENVKGRSGHHYDTHYGFCLETQHFPDSPNQPNFPTTVLKPGQVYHSETVYRFFVVD